MQAEQNSNTEKKSVAVGIAKRVATILVFIAVQIVLLFVSSGQTSWIWPWVYVGASLIILVVNGIIMLKTSPETVAERGQPGETKDWDKIIAGLLAVMQYLALPIVAGLDIRFAWTGKITLAWQIGGGVLFLASGGLSGWAMIANAYFSTAVRIQKDRGHTVCSTGPYAYVRHPGYVGFILQALAVPLLLGSWWALVPGLAAMAMIVTRTVFEDRTLQAELPGYAEYAMKVRFRLIPGMW